MIKKTDSFSKVEYENTSEYGLHYNENIYSLYIPSAFHNTQLVITDATGRTLKTYPISSAGSGKQIIYGNELSGGMYQYSLLIVGKVIDTKKMILTK